MLTELVKGDWYEEIMPISVCRTTVDWLQNEYRVKFGELGALCQIRAKAAPGIGELILIDGDAVVRGELLPKWIKDDELIHEAKRAIKYLKEITETADCPTPKVVADWALANVSPLPDDDGYEYRGIARTAFVERQQDAAQLNEIEYKFPQTAPITSRAVMYRLTFDGHTYYAGYSPAKTKVVWLNVDPPNEGFELVLKGI
jgi:hypothetical protein